MTTATGLGTTGVLLSHSFTHLPPKYDSLSQFVALVLYTIGLSTFLLGLSFLSRLSSPARNTLLASCVALLLILVGSAKILLTRSNLDSTSPDWLANALLQDSVPLHQLRLFRIPRSFHYGLNFYLHQEVQDWETERVEDGYVLSDGNYCDQLQTQQRCVDLWGTRDFSSGSWALLRVTSNSSVQGSRSGEHVH